jgi:hypothetical protein
MQLQENMEEDGATNRIQRKRDKNRHHVTDLIETARK